MSWCSSEQISDVGWTPAAVLGLCTMVDVQPRSSAQPADTSSIVVGYLESVSSFVTDVLHSLVTSFYLFPSLVSPFHKNENIKS